MSDKAPKKETFEDHQRKVEEAVRALESGQLGLEESLEQYEAGMTALKKCYEILNQIEKKIEVLVQQKDGSLGAKPLQAESEVTARKKS